MNKHEINMRLAEIEGHTGISIYHDVEWNPVEDWSQGGKLIEKYKIMVSPYYRDHNGKFKGWIADDIDNPRLIVIADHDIYEAPLLAAMIAIIKAHDKAV